MTTTERILSGTLPHCLEGGHWRHYIGHLLAPTYDGFCRMWFNVMYVRAQGYERDYDNEE